MSPPVVTTQRQSSRVRYKAAVESSSTFLTVLSLFAVALALTTGTCSDTLTRAYIFLLISSLLAISIIALILAGSAVRDFCKHGKNDYWLLGIALGWLGFATMATAMAGFTAGERDGLMLSACRMCPEGFRGSFEDSDVESVCGVFLKRR